MAEQVVDDELEFTGRPEWFKSSDAFIKHGDGCLETRLEQLDSFLTPNALFFVRNNGTSLAVDVETYRLTVAGDAVTKPLELSYEEILALPARTLPCYLECGGNHRAFFGLVTGRPTGDTQWKTGGVGMAEWTGVPLRDVLALAGVKDTAVDVQLTGLDADAPEGGFRRPLPIEKALDPDTLLAYKMNGVALPPDHGFPVRAIVPGWVGSSSIKWLGAIEVSSWRIWSRNNTTSYVMMGEDYPPEGEARGVVATHQTIKSALALPWPAPLTAGRQSLRGFAHSPHAPIVRVEWHVDDETVWREAKLLDPPVTHAWRRFEIEWEATPGEHVIRTRATDQHGNTQPDEIPFNRKGYLFNAVLPHPVTIGG